MIAKVSERTPARGRLNSKVRAEGSRRPSRPPGAGTVTAPGAGRAVLPQLQLSMQWPAGAAAAAALVAHRAALPRHAVRRWLRHALAADAEITVRLVGADEGRALNAGYRQRDYATNVLTFAYSQTPQVQADLVLCIEVVAREARAQRIPLAQHYAHLIVHGALHAQGWDHETSEADALAMEARETAILGRLGWPDPYRNRSRKT